jgi:hypothetical protein
MQGALDNFLLPIPGWMQHVLGVHPSDHGRFKVEAVSDDDCRIQAVLLSHCAGYDHPDDAGADRARRAYHEGIIASDLYGLRGFAWGDVFCRLQDERKKRDWLFVIYAEGPQVPLHPPDLPQYLRQQVPLPKGSDA